MPLIRTVTMKRARRHHAVDGLQSIKGDIDIRTSFRLIVRIGHATVLTAYQKGIAINTTV